MPPPGWRRLSRDLPRALAHCCSMGDGSLLAPRRLKSGASIRPMKPPLQGMGHPIVRLWNGLAGDPAVLLFRPESRVFFAAEFLGVLDLVHLEVHGALAPGELVLDARLEGLAPPLHLSIDEQGRTDALVPLVLPARRGWRSLDPQIDKGPRGRGIRPVGARGAQPYLAFAGNDNRRLRLSHHRTGVALALVEQQHARHFPLKRTHRAVECDAQVPAAARLRRVFEPCNRRVGEQPIQPARPSGQGKGPRQ
jgi:hypothetical protein